MSAISQRAARRLQLRVKQLEAILAAERREWSKVYPPGSVNITTLDGSATPVGVHAAISTARRLNHAVVVVDDDKGSLRFMALPYTDVPEAAQ